MAKPTPNRDQTQQLVLVKHEQKWIFKYEHGQEETVLQWLADHARSADSPLDWFDAAVLSQQMGDQLHAQLKQIMKKDHNIDLHTA